MLLSLFFSNIVCYPFYIENTGAEYGIAGEDIKVVPVWKLGLSGKGINIRFIGSGFNETNPCIKSKFIPDKSYNYHSQSRKSEIIGTSVVAATLGDWNVSLVEGEDKPIYGIANSSRFAFTVPSYENGSIKEYFDSIRRYSEDDDIIVDFVTSGSFNWSGQERIYYKRRDREVNAFIKDKAGLGRKYKGTIIIAPSYTIDGNMKKSNSIFEPFDEAFLIGASDYIGGPSYHTYYSTATLVNAPIMGNGDLSYYRYYPLINFAAPNNYPNQLYYYPFSCSIVAGAVALLLENNPDLSYRDVQYILALSASKNDPTHPFWIKNAAGYEYNPIYGFGRINVVEAIRISEYWTSAYLPSCSLYSSEYKDVHLEVPYARTGKLELEFDIHTINNYAFTESVQFRFNLSTPIISMLRIIVKSPSGTKSEILKPDAKFPSGSTNEYAKDEYQILTRCFFGENPNGKWKVTIIDSSFTKGKTLNHASLVVKAMDEKPTLPDVMPYQTKESIYSFDSKQENITLKIESNVIQCGSYFEINATLDGVNNTLPLFIADKRNRRMTPISNYIKKNNRFYAMIPCIYESTDNFKIVAQYRPLNVSRSLQISYINNHTYDGIQSPNPYEIFVSEPDERVIVNISLVEHRKELPIFGHGSKYVYGLYDIDNNSLIAEHEVFIHNIPAVSVKLPSMKPRKGILSIVPVDVDNPSPCDAFLVPISFWFDMQNQTIPFAVPLNDYCPLPNGIKTSIPSKTENRVLKWLSSKVGIIVVTTVSIVIVVVIIIIIIFCRKSRSFNGPNALDDQILL